MTVQEFLEMNESSIGPTGAAWDDCNSLLMLNKARSALYGVDNWSGLIDKICVPCGEKIYLPWFADRAVGAYECKGIVHIATGEYWTGVSGSCCGNSLGIVDLNKVAPIPVSNEFSTRIGIRITDIEDANTEVVITYQNHEGAWLTETLSSSDFNHLSVTESKVKHIISIKKPSTHGFIQFYATNSDGECCGMLFQAHPMEQHLQYKTYCVPSCCDPSKKIILDVKRKFIRFTDKHYNLPIDFSEHALSLAMEAIASKDTRTQEGRAAYRDQIQLAINYLRKNEIKEKQSYGDGGQSNDYPSFVA
jgi:hypothetical protein